MDIPSILTIAASVAGVVGVLVGAWQLRVQILERHDIVSTPSADSHQHVTGAFPVSAPLGRLPSRVLGRERLFSELQGALRKRRGGVWVLTGMGGIGKSTVALQAAKVAHEQGWQVWWVNASDTATLTGGILEILDRLGAPRSVLRTVQEGAPVAIDRAWDILVRHRGARHCMLIFDNADTPEILGLGGNSPSDGTGWIRPKVPVLQIVTTRHGAPTTWGSEAHIRALGPLDDASGAEALRDLVGRADTDNIGAVNLSRRLGGLPLALHLAGTYLGSSFARWSNFTDYLSALDSPEFADAVSRLDNDSTDPRLTVAGTWELSVNALASRGVPQAKALLHLLACFAPSTPIPAAILRPDLLGPLLTPPYGERSEVNKNIPDNHEKLVLQGFQGLATVGLIDIIQRPHETHGPTLTVHPIISDINRASLLARNLTDLPAVAYSLVNIMDSAAAELDPLDPESWPIYRSLMPHLSALLLWLSPELEAKELGRLVHVCANTCEALIECGNWDDAESLARLTVRFATRLSENNYETFKSRCLLAAAVEHHGGHAEAEAIYRNVLENQRRVLGGEHPDALRTSQQLAWVIGEQGRFDEAEPRLRETSTAQMETLGIDHTDTQNTLHDLAWATAGKNHYQEGEDLCRRVLDARERTIGSEHPYTLATKALLVWIIAQRDRHHEAEQMGRMLYKQKRRILGEDHPLTLRQAYQLATDILSQDRQAEARELLRETLTKQEIVLGINHAETVATRTEITSIKSPNNRIFSITRMKSIITLHAMPIKRRKAINQ
jgi:Tetratricopeptide repeat